MDMISFQKYWMKLKKKDVCRGMGMSRMKKEKLNKEKKI